MYRNLRDIEVGLICKLLNDAQPVTSHCIMSFENTVIRTRNLIKKLGKVAYIIMFCLARISRYSVLVKNSALVVIIIYELL